MPPAIDVHQELQMVAQLQDVDNKIQDLEDEKGDLPRLVNQMNKKYDKREDMTRELNDRVAEVRKQKRNLEGQIQLSKAKLKKYKEQLYSVTTNREYDAITQQIDTSEKEIETQEAAELSLLEQEEMLLSQIEELKGEMGSISKDLDERKKELGDQEEETEQEELTLQHERDKLAVRIKKPILAHYERIREAKGVGAARLFNAACGSCFAVVPPQRQAEIRKMDDIILCESCGVILLPEADEE